MYKSIFLNVKILKSIVYLSNNILKIPLKVDHTRIKLLNRTNEPNNPIESDYINANRIVVSLKCMRLASFKRRLLTMCLQFKSEESFSKTYLATQGPLSNTINDFWQMVWQEESQIILMITHEEEKGRVKMLI